MRQNEVDPELRRTVLLVYLDDGVTPATDAHTLPAGSREVSINGAAPIAATGTLVGDGAGEYYYQWSSSEVAAVGFVAFKLEWPGYTTLWETEDVGDLFSVGETVAAKLRLPLLVYDSQEPPQLASATITLASQLKTSLNDISFADAPGTLHTVDTGLHYYQALPSEVTDEGLLVVKFEKTGFQTQVVFARISSPTISDATLLSLSPSPDTSPGDPGGFPAGVDVASSTPIVAVVENGAPNVDRLFVTAAVDGAEEVVYYGGLFRGRYAGGSQSVVGDQLTLSISRTGGWSKLAGSMLLTIEGVTPTQYTMLLPSVGGTGEIASVAVVSAAPGALDHAAEAIDRLPRQFRNKPRIEGLLAALCTSIQTLENAAVDVLANLDVDVSIGSILRALAHRVGQSTDGVGDDDTLRRFVKARIAANRSSGTTEDLIAVTRLVLGSPTTTVHVETRTVATIVVTLGAATTSDVVAILLLFLTVARKAGVRLRVVYSSSSPIFRFNTGPGFNVGHLSTSAE